MGIDRLTKTIGEIWLAVVGTVFFTDGYRAIVVVTEEGGKCFVFLDQPADTAAFKSALQTAVGEIAGAVCDDAVKYN